MKNNTNIYDPDISVIIPIYNEEENIYELYNKLVNVLEKDIKVKYELIFIDDGSRDNTWDILNELNQ